MFVSFNYKDGQKTITFADIKGSDFTSRGAPDITLTRSSR